MRFVIVSLICLPLFIMGCAFFSPPSESGPNPQQNHTHRSDTHNSTDDDNSRMDMDLQTVELGEKPRQMPQHVQDKNAKAVEDHGWNNEALQHITAFQSLLSTDIEAAHATSAEIAKIRFGSHPLADEWSELFFRLYRDRKGHLLDVKRYWKFNYCQI